MSNPAPRKPFKKGKDERRNVTGANKGHNSFETDFNLVVEEVAKLNKITFSEARQNLLKKAYLESNKGNFQFFKYIHDQLYGAAKQNIDHTTNGKDLFVPSERIRELAILLRDEAKRKSR